MAGDDPVRTCPDELRDNGGMLAAREIATQCNIALPGRQAAAPELVAKTSRDGLTCQLRRRPGAAKGGAAGARFIWTGIARGRVRW